MALNVQCFAVKYARLLLTNHQFSQSNAVQKC